LNRRGAKKRDQIELAAPYEIPKGWTWTFLSELASFENGDRGKNYPSRDKFVKMAWHL